MSSSTDSLTGTSLSSADVSYTALVATLVLLLAVSSAIVIRSLVLRRRHQRLVEEAIRTGTWLPHHFNSTARRRRDIGQKPKLWENWLNPHVDDGEGEVDEKRSWANVSPFYAAYINEPAPSPHGSTASSAENSADPSSRPPRFIRPFARRRSPPLPQPSSVSPLAGQTLSLPSSSPTATPTPAVRVAVLIAMPDPSQKHGDENGPPVVEIGVVEVNVNDETQTSGRDSS